jgi:hypothetical protein
MHVEELWHFPVKSLRGSRIDEALLDHGGIATDRLVHVREPATGRVVTSRTRPELLLLQGGVEDGVPTVDGHDWRSATALALVRDAAGADTVLQSTTGVGPERFDVLPLSVVTDGMVDAAGFDRRRFRCNIVVAGVPGTAERTWAGSLLVAGDVPIYAKKLRSRCVMTTFDPDTIEQDILVLRTIAERWDGCIALDCVALIDGLLRVGEPVSVERPSRAAPARTAPLPPAQRR